MRYKIIYDKPGRLRVRCGADVFEKTQEVPLCARLLRLPIRFVGKGVAHKRRYSCVL